MTSSCKSPKWRKPSIIKLRKNKRSSISTPFHVPSSLQSEIASPVLSIVNNKRKNPFGVKSDISIKRRHSETASDLNLQNQTSPLFSFLNSTPTFFEEESLDSFSTQSYANQLPIVPKSNDELPNQPSLTSQSHDRTDQSSEHLPADWSIKTKVRFLSSSPFNWCSNMRSCDEAGGVLAFTSQSTDSNISKEPLSQEVKLQKSLLYWTHPHLPWLKTFPRILPDNKVRLSSILDEEMKTALKSDWCESMTSIFNLLRNDLCPYFYVCSHQFTALFQSAGKGKPLRAVITPTTRGLREAMTSEGIDFTLPLHKDDTNEEFDEPDDKKDQTSKSDSTNEVADPDTIDESDAAASVWLESMGLSKENFPTLDPNRVKLQRDSFRSIDNRQESSVLVEGVHVQGAFNFLLNWRSCFALSGPQAGLPPTILSSCPFKGGTLQSLRCKQTTAKQEDVNRHRQVVHIVEISGAILTTNVDRLCRLFSHTQGHFAASFVTHEPTSVINKTVTNELCSHDVGKTSTNRESMGVDDLSEATSTSYTHSGSDDSCGGDVTSTNGESSSSGDKDIPGSVASNGQLPVTFKSIEYKDCKYTWTN